MGGRSLASIALAVGLWSTVPAASAQPLAYIARPADDYVSVFDTATNTVVGTVPVGVLVAGWIGHSVSITAVILAGAVWAVVLAAWSNVRTLQAKGAPNV